jgi:predicted RNA-binding protein with TRAM domain
MIVLTAAIDRRGLGGMTSAAPIARELSTGPQYQRSMIEIPEELRSVFTATVRERGDEHVITVPEHELDHGAMSAGESYRIAVLEAPGATTTEGSQSAESTEADEHQRPPVEEGEIREVTIETVGDKGDGIAKVERGYVVIVPDGEPGDQLTVEITNVRQNVSFATIVDPAPSRPDR